MTKSTAASSTAALLRDSSGPSQPAKAVPASSVPNNAMASPAFTAMPQPIRPPANTNVYQAAPIEAPTMNSAFDRDRESTKPVGTPSTASGSPIASNAVIIRRLPPNTTEESIRLMTVFSKDAIAVKLMPPELSEDPGCCSALLTFGSSDGALEAKNMLDGKKNIGNDVTMIVEIVATNSARRLTNDLSTNVTPGSSVASSRGSSRFQFQTFDMASAYTTNGAATGTRPPSDLANSEPVSATQMQNIFSTQSPIGTHRKDVALHTGKDLINYETTADDDTRELLKDPVKYAESDAAAAAAAAVAGSLPPNGMYAMPPQTRRPTLPQIPFTQHMANLSLNTASTGTPGTMSGYNPVTSPYSAHTNSISPPALGGPVPVPQQTGVVFHPPFRNHNHNFPAANPADQNPPCNTLYVGNIPMETSEEELKALFSKQRGYKRLSVRTKGNGPMCFVEFEDISFATKTLYELYGAMLRGSTRGGIRLSFSKNPLGVRSGQHPAHNAAGAATANMNAMGIGASGFAAASGPPPGLSAPPGLAASRAPYNTIATTLPNGVPGLSIGVTSYGSNSPPSAFNSAGLASNAWPTGGSLYYNPLSANANAANPNPNPNPSTTMNGVASGYPPYMMGK